MFLPRQQKRILSLLTRNAGSDCRLGFETRSRMKGTGEHVYRAVVPHGGVDGRTGGVEVTAGRLANRRLRMRRWRRQCRRRRRQPDTNRAERTTATIQQRSKFENEKEKNKFQTI
uniref:Uncharacterized protein n=1 Tax=Schizaphis graminum TaxID=13262 RepID=A0A2S2NRY2_SCHGA